MNRMFVVAAIGALAGSASAQVTVSSTQDITKGNGTRWTTSNNGSPEGFRIGNVFVPGGSQAVDHIFTRIGTQTANPTFNGAIRATGAQVQRTDYAEGTSLRTLGDERIPGLVAQTEYFLFNNRSTVRVITSVTNWSSEPITANVGLSHNPVSNTTFTVAGSSSGDTVLGVDDKWFVADDSNANGAVPASLTVLGNPLARVGLSHLVERQRYSGSDMNGFEATFEAWTIQPGHTAAYMTFIDFNLSRANALAKVTEFQNFTTLEGAGLLAHYDEEIQGEVVNWVPAGPTALPLAAFGVMAMRRRR